MRTVFVIGAGANVEIKMPSGKELKDEIAKRLNFKLKADETMRHDTVVYEALLYSLNRNQEQVLSVAKTIREAMPVAISIDNFIDAHRNEPAIELGGKFAIIRSILAAEKNSELNYLINNKRNTVDQTWYPLFFQKITEGCQINELIERLRNISLIIFNYDRCFEMYMIHALSVYYKIYRNQAENIVDGMNIIHPYGIIGDRRKISSDAELYYNELIELSKNIRTFAEDSDQTRDERTKIKHLIDRANRIIFLGFAYHQLNLDLLFRYPGYAVTLVDPAPPSEKVDCYGSGYSISENDRKYIQDLLKRMDSRIDHCDISGVTCVQFFNDFWYRLSFRD